jgi:hypothetical protein
MRFLIPTACEAQSRRRLENRKALVLFAGVCFAVLIAVQAVDPWGPGEAIYVYFHAEHSADFYQANDTARDAKLKTCSTASSATNSGCDAVRAAAVLSDDPSYHAIAAAANAGWQTAPTQVKRSSDFAPACDGFAVFCPR